MNKIYNNLSVDNLTKTEWFNQFNEYQKSEILDGIRKGLENNLDVSIYAKPEYSWKQMHQIREGLEANLDVSEYAKPKYSGQKMEEIRNQLQESTL